MSVVEKVMIEIDLPGNCEECKLSYVDERYEAVYCPLLGLWQSPEDYDEEARRNDCPLKPAEKTFIDVCRHCGKKIKTFERGRDVDFCDEDCKSDWYELKYRKAGIPL